MFRSALSTVVSRTSRQTMQRCSLMAHASSAQCGILPVRAGLRQAGGDQPVEHISVFFMQCVSMLQAYVHNTEIIKFLQAISVPPSALPHHAPRLATGSLHYPKVGHDIYPEHANVVAISDVLLISLLITCKRFLLYLGANGWPVAANRKGIWTPRGMHRADVSSCLLQGPSQRTQQSPAPDSSAAQQGAAQREAVP